MKTEGDISSEDNGQREASPSLAGKVFLILSLVLLGATAFHFSLIAKYPVERVRRAIEFPYQLDAEEGFLLGQALRLQSGEGLYGSIDSEPYVVDNYPPLYPAIWSVAARWSGESLSAGRWISALSALAAGLAILTGVLGHGPLGSVITGFLRRKKTEQEESPSPRGRGAAESFLLSIQSLFLAWSCVLMFLTSFALMRWVGYARVDLLSVALSAWGVVVFGLGARRRWGRSAAIALFALALLAKQTSVAGPLACLIWLAARDRRQAAWFAAAMALAGGLPVAIFTVWTDGRYWLHTVAYNENVMYWNELLGWARHLWRFYAPMILATGVLALWALWQIIRAAMHGEREKSCQSAAPLGLYLGYFGLNVLSLAALAKAGAAENYFLEPICATVIFIGVGLGALLLKTFSGKACRLTMLLGVLVLILLTLHGFRYSGVGKGFGGLSGPFAYSTAPSPSVSAFIQGDRVVGEIASRPGPVLCEDPIYLLRAGKKIVFQNFIMTQLTAEGKWDESAFLERTERGEFSLLVAHKDLQKDQFFNRYSPALLQAIRGRYRLLGRLDRPPPLQPIFLYVPKDNDF